MMMQGSIDSVIKEASTNLCEGSMNAEEATAYVVEECNNLFDEYNREMCIRDSGAPGNGSQESGEVNADV